MLPVFSQSSTPPPASAAGQTQHIAVEEASTLAPAPLSEEELAAFDVYAVHARHQDCTEHPGFQVKRYRRTAPASSQASSGDSFLLVESSSQHCPPMSASAKCMPLLPRPSLQTPRLGRPKHQVADLAVPGSAVSVKPQFSVKYPSHHPGTPKPPPLFSKRASLRPPASQLGGAPAPSAKPRPKSIPQAKPPSLPGTSPGTCAARHRTQASASPHSEGSVVASSLRGTT